MKWKIYFLNDLLLQWNTHHLWVFEGKVTRLRPTVRERDGKMHGAFHSACTSVHRQPEVLECIKEPSFKRKEKLPRAEACVSPPVYMKGKIHIHRAFFSSFKLHHATALKDPILARICSNVKQQMQHNCNIGVREKVLWLGFFSTCFQRCARLTVALTECAWAELAAARRAGQEQAATSGCATPSASNTEPARMASASAIKAGTENTALSVSISAYLCVRVRVCLVARLFINYVGVQRLPVRLDCDSYFALHSGNLEMRKGWEKQIIRDLQGSAGEMEGLKGSVWA